MLLPSLTDGLRNPPTTKTTGVNYFSATVSAVLSADPTTSASTNRAQRTRKLGRSKTLVVNANNSESATSIPVWADFTNRSTYWSVRKRAQVNVSVGRLEFEVAVTAERLETYYEAAEDAGWPDHRPDYDGTPFRYGWDADRRREVAAILEVFITEVATDEAIEHWKLGQEFQQSLSKATSPPEQAKRIDIDADSLIEQYDAPVVGDTDEILDAMAQFTETCGYEDLVIIPAFNLAGMTREEHEIQLQSFAEDVVPYLEDER